MVKKIILVLILLPLLLWIFAPKKSLVYWGEKQWAAQGITVTGSAIHEHPFGLTIEHPVVYFKGAKVATAKAISLWSVLLYTHGEADAIRIDPAFKAFAPSQIGAVVLTHSVIAPLRAPVAINDPHFSGSGHIDLNTHVLQLLFPTLPKSSPLKRYLKQTKGGWTYERTF